MLYNKKAKLTGCFFSFLRLSHNGGSNPGPFRYE